MHLNSSFISNIETVIIHAPIGILSKIHDSIKPLRLNTIKSFEYSKIQEFEKLRQAEISRVPQAVVQQLEAADERAEL